MTFQHLLFKSLALTIGGCSFVKSSPEIDLAHWMKNLDADLKSKPLMDLAIPGSHNSMTYRIVGTNKIGPDSDSVFLRAVKILANDKVVKWTRNQNLNTTEQLLAGIRFFDLRVAKVFTNKLYYTHGITAGEVTQPLNEIKAFVDTHPEEVVMLYFQNFYGLTHAEHADFMQKLRDLFGTRLIPKTSYEDLTIKKAAMANQSIIILYNAATQINYPIWPGYEISAPWPNKQSTSDLMYYLQNTEREYEQFFVRQAVLTPTAFFIAFRMNSNILEECAKPVLYEIIPQLDGKLPKPINVVIADFIELENNLFPRTIIALNYKSKLNYN